MYPNNRLLFLVFDTRSQKERVILARMRRTEEYLASVMDDVAVVWNARHGLHNRLPHMFDEHVTGSVDTFPVYVSRAKDNWWQKKMYNGKYGLICAYTHMRFRIHVVACAYAA